MKETRKKQLFFRGLIIFFVLFFSLEAVCGLNCTDQGSDGIADNMITVCIDSSCNCSCDGADDQVEIQYAVNNASSGMIVHINTGIYVVNNTIWMNNSGVTFEGEGNTSILKIVDNATDPPWTQTTPMVNVNNDSITIQNLKFDGNFDNQTLPGGANYLDLIHVYGDNIVIRNNSFHDGKCDAIDSTTVSNLSVTGNYFLNIDHEPVTGSYSNSEIIGNTVYLDTNVHGTNAAFRLYRGDCNIWRSNTVSRKKGIIKVISMGFEIHSYNNNSNSHGLIENNTLMDQYANAIIFNRGSSSPTTDKSKCTNYTIRNNIINNVILYASNESNGIKLWDTHWNNFTIENNVIYSAAGDGIWLGGNISKIIIKNNIIAGNNRNGIIVWNASNISNSYNNIWNNTISNYNGTINGTGNISADPLFANPANGDFHLKSEQGRWNGTGWVTDNETSPCIDAGDPTSDYSKEMPPNGGRINMGSYGNTLEASMSPLTVVVSLLNGTNLISAPLNLSTWILGEVAVVGDTLPTQPPESITSIYRYDPRTTLYEKNDYFDGWGWWPAAGSENFTQLEPGRGYIVMAEQDCNLTFTGNSPYYIEINLTAGNNLIGWFSNTNAILGEFAVFGDPLPTQPPESISKLQRYNTQTKSYENVTNIEGWGWHPEAGSENFTQLEPGRGYWAVVEQNSTLTQGQKTGTITGTVTDGTNPIEDATVQTNSYSDKTNSTGKYRITLVTGNYTVTASASGYQSESKNATILENQTTELNFTLTKITTITTTTLHYGGGGSGGGGGSYAAKPKPSCFDGIMNCHTGSCEIGIDCGGPCTPCMSCSDGIQNQGETGVDCGGPCTPCETTTSTSTTFTTTTKTTTTSTLETTTSTTTGATTTTIPEKKEKFPWTAATAIVLAAGGAAAFLFLRGRGTGGELGEDVGGVKTEVERGR